MVGIGGIRDLSPRSSTERPRCAHLSENKLSTKRYCLFHRISLHSAQRLCWTRLHFVSLPVPSLSATQSGRVAFIALCYFRRVSHRTPTARSEQPASNKEHGRRSSCVQLPPTQVFTLLNRSFCLQNLQLLLHVNYRSNHQGCLPVPLQPFLDMVGEQVHVVGVTHLRLVGEQQVEVGGWCCPSVILHG